MTDDCNTSSDPSPSDSSDPLLESWEVVAAFMEPFLAEWEGGAGPPLIEDHLPGEPQYRRDVLLELVKVDIDYRQQYGLGGNRVEDYVDVYPEILVGGVVPSELVLEEFQIRRGSGESVTGTEYLERFPEHRSALEPFLVDDDETVIPDVNTIPRHAEFAAGDRLDDFYIMSKLGQGAFASVYLARQESMQRLLALKVSADKGSEAQTLAQLDHPHIVRVYDQHRIPSERLLLLYMQFAPGGTLHALLAKSRDAESTDGRLVAECVRNALAKTGVLSPNDVFIKETIAQSSWIELTCHFGIELARALEYAHGRGVLHRDLKPANVLLDANGSCKLADFNISFASEVAGQDAAQSFGGSVAYMPPEQLAACHPTLPVSPADVDERCDTYALGVLLWEFATGKRPFNEVDLGKTWSEILEEMIRRRELPPTEGDWDNSDPSGVALRRLLLRCLRSEPVDRVASAAAFADELSVCREPVVASISNRSEGGWERLVADWTVPALLAAIILPNVPAALFAWFYNNENLQLSLANPADMQTFDRVQSTINGIAFPTAIALLIWYCRKISRGLRRRARPSRQDAEVCKRRMFRIALFGSAVGIVEWTIAAIAYPVTLHYLLGGLSVTNWGHFFFSHVLSGMIAAAYPFFIVTTLLLRSFLPRWLTVRADNRLSEVHEDELDRVGELSDWSLLVAGAVPALGIFALLFLLGETDPQHEFALKILSLLGAFGFAGVFWLYRRIQADLDAYRRVIRSSVATSG